ncbi:MAG: LPXTG cell wall anchor domain-containing protein [Muribaculaceae bacterium]|nr:LPXTG cell wall anchor domain-containing protein [Muribaculaceae bacterium]
MGEWKTPWFIFAGFALVVAVAFMFLFKYKHVHDDESSAAKTAEA